MTTKITHPNPTPGIVSAVGVDFVDGSAEIPDLDDETKAILIAHGYTFEAVASTVEVIESDKDQKSAADEIIIEAQTVTAEEAANLPPAVVDGAEIGKDGIPILREDESRSTPSEVEASEQAPESESESETDPTPARSKPASPRRPAAK